MFYLRKKYAYREESNGEGDGGSAAAGADGAEGADGASQTEGQTESASAEIEAEARKMGWTEKAAFKGDPDKWRDAAEFVERGRTMLPILKKTVDKQDRKIADLERSIKEFAEYHNKVEQRAYAKAYGDLKAQQMEAVAAGDTEAFQAVDEKIEALHKDVAKNRPPAPPKDDQQEDPIYADWAARNKWMDTDKEMAAYAEGHGVYLNKARGLTGVDLLEEVTKAVKAQFPEKFQNPRRAAAPSVEGATSVAKKGGKTYADMPKEDRDTCDRMMQRYGIKKEEYVRTYFEGN